MPETFQRAIGSTDLPEGAARALTLAGAPVLLCRVDGRIHALINRCSHADSPLDGGRIRRGAIICPLHGAIFNLTTGQCLGSAGYGPLTVLATRETDGWIDVAVGAASPPS